MKSLPNEGSTIELSTTQPLISFVVPCYEEADNVVAFYEAMVDTFHGAGRRLQLVFVDDGSKDSTFQKIQEVAARCKEKPEGVSVVGIQFSRNFGKEAAIWAGLNNADGDIIGIIDGDLQQPPRDALAMVELLESDPNTDCVAAYQAERKEKKLAAWLHSTFYRILKSLSGLDVVNNASDFRVFRRTVLNAILSMPENFRFSKGIFAWIGFNTVPYPYVPDERHAGTSKFSFFKLLSYALEGIFAFSVRPLRIATILGFVISVLAIVYFIIILVRTLVVGVETPGYATTIGVVLLIGGLQLVMLGIIGEYLAKTFIQTKDRPLYIERSRTTS